MGLTKYRIGDLISIVDEKNKEGIKSFYGININKEFMPTVANTDNLDEKKYKIVRKNRFVFSGMQTGRDECIRISMYSEDNPIIVSPAYTTFEVSAEDKILPTYLFMMFLSKEKDRLGWFYSDSSVRANLDWNVFCDIEIKIPSINIQQKYVDIYNAMIENQKTYEIGLEDLKLVCDISIEKLKREVLNEKIGNYIEVSDKKNEELYYNVDDVRGISVEKRFIHTKADLSGVSLKPYYIVEPNEFAYVPVTSRNSEKISIACNESSKSVICSSSYIVFKVLETKKLLPGYLNMFFNRDEFNRYCRFNSWGSARETFDWTDMCEVKIPIPDINVQKSIVKIYSAYIIRRDINERLKLQLKDICPILIKGSLLEEANL